MHLYAENLTPTSYAARLATYISDPSTIRARTLEYFGRAPSVEQCRNLRNVEVNKRRLNDRAYKPVSERYIRHCRTHPYDENEYAIDINGNEHCVACIKEKQAKERAAELERIARWEAEQKARSVATERAKRSRKHEIEAEREGKIEPFIGGRPRVATETIKTVCDLMGVSLDEVMADNRGKRLVDARSVCVKLFRSGERPLSYPQIARILGKACHSTIINLDDKFHDRAKANPRMWEVYDALMGAE